MFADVEPPEVVSCDGPVKDEKGFIYADDDEKEVTWKVRQVDPQVHA